MDCERTTLRLEAYELGFLEGAERRAVEEHLIACAACRETLAEVRQTVALLEKLPEAAAPERLPDPAPAPAGRPAGSGTRRFAIGLGIAAAWLLAASLGAAAMAIALGRGGGIQDGIQDGGGAYGAEAERLAAISRLIEGQERLLGELAEARAENERLRRASEELQSLAADLGERLDRLAAFEERSPEPEAPISPPAAPEVEESRTPWGAAYRLATGVIEDRGNNIYRRTRAYQEELTRIYGGKD